MKEITVATKTAGSSTPEPDQPCLFGFFDRKEGVSASPFHSLNVSFGVGDSEQSVLDNRELVKNRMGITRLLSARQIHGDNIYVLNTPLEHDLEVDGYDSLITNQTGVGLMIQQADCQAVLLYDKVQGVIGAVHCGWRGSVAELIKKTVARMKQEFSTDPVDLQAVVSPSLGPCCSEFIHYKRELPHSFLPFILKENHFDFWKISEMQLIQCGVQGEQITLSAICTRCSNEYFSYRRACRDSDGVTGRNCSVITMNTTIS